MARNARAWATIVQRNVGYCFDDQPHDRELDWVLGERTEVRELFESAGVPEHLWERVARFIRCPYCGRRGFDLDDDIGTYDAWEREALRRSAEWSKRWKPELDAFAKHLAAFPYLGMAHPMGQRIATAIDELPLDTLADELWWRARQPEGAREFTDSDMLPPPPRNAQSEGRYNHFGQVVFYLASSAEGAIREVLNNTKREIVAWVQPFKINNLDGVLNLTESDPYELGVMRRHPVDVNNCVRYAGILCGARQSSFPMISMQNCVMRPRGGGARSVTSRGKRSRRMWAASQPGASSLPKRDEAEFVTRRGASKRSSVRRRADHADRRCRPALRLRRRGRRRPRSEPATSRVVSRASPRP